MMGECSFCQESEASYQCPKCSKLYCSLKCYRHETHLSCHESFCRNWVESDYFQDGSLNPLLKSSLSTAHPRSAEGLINDHVGDDSVDDDGEDGNCDYSEEEEWDSPSDSPVPIDAKDLCVPDSDVNSKLAQLGISLDVEDGALWAEKLLERLPPEQLEQFRELIRAQELFDISDMPRSELLELANPWWIRLANPIMELDDEAEPPQDFCNDLRQTDFCQKVNGIKFSSKTNFETVSNNIVNVLAAYAVVKRQTFWRKTGSSQLLTIEDLPEMESLSTALSSSENFADPRLAVVAVTSLEGCQFPQKVKSAILNDVTLLISKVDSMRCECTGLKLATLGIFELWCVLLKQKKSLKHKKDEWRKVVTLMKKLEFFGKVLETKEEKTGDKLCGEKLYGFCAGKILPQLAMECYTDNSE